MSVKLIAMGNILMKDDGIGIEIAKRIEDKLLLKNVEVIYGETDFDYCISKVKENDVIYILDGAILGKQPGDITRIPINCFVPKRSGFAQHSYSFLDLLKIYCTSVSGEIFAIEIYEVEFNYGLSCVMKEKLDNISKEIYNLIEKRL